MGSSPISCIKRKTQTSNRLGLFFLCRGVPCPQGSSSPLRFGRRKAEVPQNSCVSPHSGFVGWFDGKKVRWTFFLIRLTPSPVYKTSALSKYDKKDVFLLNFRRKTMFLGNLLPYKVVMSFYCVIKLKSDIIQQNF